MSLTIVLAQMNFVVGDIAGNVDKVVDAAHRARDEYQAQIVIFPELTLTGYPPEDLLLKPSFIKVVDFYLQQLCEKLQGVAALVGYPRQKDARLFNAAGLIKDGRIEVEYFKQALPNYSVFDEKRYFTKGTQACVFELYGTRFGITICEDVWQDGPIDMATAAGAQVILNLNASPFDIYKLQQREELLIRKARQHEVAIVYANLVGGQDELVFDGGSMVVDQQGVICQRTVGFAALCVGQTSDALWSGVADKILCPYLAIVHPLVFPGSDGCKKHTNDG